jgi:hypothetical protein
MSPDVQLMLIVVGMHLLGLVCAGALLLPALRDGGDLPPRTDQDSEGGWGHGPPKPPTPSDVPSGGLLLPDALPARVRLRDHRRLPDLLPPRERRPAHAPTRTPAREPATR